MKTPVSILAMIALLVVTALGVPGTHAEQSIVSNNINSANALSTSQPSHNEKASWAPIRALRAMNSPQQGLLDGGKKKHHHHSPKDARTKQTSRALFEEEVVAFTHRVLGHAPLVTPASTITSTSKPTPAPTKPHTPKATPARTKPHTPKVTPAATKPTTYKPKVTTVPSPTTKKPTKTTSISTTNKPKLTPAATKSTTPKTTPTPTVYKGFGPVQQTTRNLREDRANKQQLSPPCDHKHGDKPIQKNGKEHN